MREIYLVESVRTGIAKAGKNSWFTHLRADDLCALVINEALRRGLTTTPDAAPYAVRVHHSGVRPGIDVTALNRLADEIEDDELTAGAGS